MIQFEHQSGTVRNFEWFRVKHSKAITYRKNYLSSSIRQTETFIIFFHLNLGPRFFPCLFLLLLFSFIQTSFVILFEVLWSFGGKFDDWAECIFNPLTTGVRWKFIHTSTNLQVCAASSFKYARTFSGRKG